MKTGTIMGRAYFLDNGKLYSQLTEKEGTCLNKCIQCRQPCLGNICPKCAKAKGSLDALAEIESEEK